MPPRPTPAKRNALSHVTTHHLFSLSPWTACGVNIREPRSNFRLRATKSHTCHAKCAFTRHNTSLFLTFPIDSGRRKHWSTAKQLSFECHKVPRLPREMYFYPSQNITFSHFPHRQRDDAIREQKQNDEQTVHHPQTPQERKQEPFATLRENTNGCGMLSLRALNLASA